MQMTSPESVRLVSSGSSKYEVASGAAKTLDGSQSLWDDRVALLRKCDSASEPITRRALQLPLSCGLSQREPTAVDARRIAAWDSLIARLQEQCQFVISERGQEQASRDCGKQDARTPWHKLQQVAVRAVKCERLRVLSYCVELIDLADETVTLSHKTLLTGPRALTARVYNMRRALQRCLDLLQGETQILDKLNDHAQHTTYVLAKAGMTPAKVAEIKHAFCDPPRLVVLRGAAQCKGMHTLYSFYVQVLNELQHISLPETQRAIREALARLDDLTPGPRREARLALNSGNSGAFAHSQFYRAG